MGTIKELTKDTVAKIAAGEVVDRPASVVKELIENSIDAQANNIKIFLEDFGLKEITVIDDGVGMSKDDLFECFKRHTTSKISEIDDLNNILHFGFRGEALFSISSVSQMEISSRPENSIEGYFIQLNGLQIVSSGMIGMPLGTKVSVKNLFYNVPARKKFLKDQTEELRIISNNVVKMCLSHPEISFKFYHNGSELLNLNKDQSYIDRIRNLIAVDLLEVKGEANSISVHGYISRPENFRSSKNKQFLYVNRRHIKDNEMSEVVKSAYGTLIDYKRYPQFVLYIDASPEFIDVNVHPQKEKVRFSDVNIVLDLIRSSVVASLQANDLTPNNSPYSALKDFYKEISPLSSMVVRDSLEQYKTIQIVNLFIARDVEKGLLLIDQHAAHERIIFEKLLAMADNTELRYKLEEPFQLQLDLPDQLLLEQKLEILNKFGFDIRDKVLYAVPAFLQGRNLAVIINEYLDSENYELDTNSQRALSHLACKLAIKDGETLDNSTMDILVKELNACTNPYTCPHGRPAQILISATELKKWFKRFN